MPETSDGQIGMIEFAIDESLKVAYDNEKELVLAEDVQVIKDLIREEWARKYKNTVAGWRENGKNLVLHLKTKQLENQALGRLRFWTIDEVARLKVMVRPWIIWGSYDFRHYQIKITLPSQLPLDLALEYIEKKWETVTISVGNKNA